MKHTYRILIGLLVLAGLLALSIPSLAATAGGTASFLACSIGARGLALGGAYSAAVTDVTSLCWNPAGLAGANDKEIAAAHTGLFAGTSIDWLSLAAPIHLLGTNPGRFGAGWRQLASRDIPKTDGAGNVIGAYDVVDSIASAGYAISKARWRTGIAVRWINQRIDGDAGTGFTADVGVQYRLQPQTTLAGVLENALATPVHWTTGLTERLDVSWRLGVAHTWKQGWTSMFEVAPEGDVRAGTEIALTPDVAGRVGWNAGQLSAGIGLDTDHLQVDYALTRHPDLGLTHRFSVIIPF